MVSTGLTSLFYLKEIPGLFTWETHLCLKLFSSKTILIFNVISFEYMSTVYKLLCDKDIPLK